RRLPEADTQRDERARQPAGDDAAPEAHEWQPWLPGGEPEAEADRSLRLGGVQLRMRRAPRVVAQERIRRRSAGARSAAVRAAATRTAAEDGVVEAGLGQP